MQSVEFLSTHSQTTFLIFPTHLCLRTTAMHQGLFIQRNMYSLCTEDIICVNRW